MCEGNDWKCGSHKMAEQSMIWINFNTISFIDKNQNKWHWPCLQAGFYSMANRCLSVVHTEQLFGIEYEFTPYEGE